jgi:hypothetical protein
MIQTNKNEFTGFQIDTLSKGQSGLINARNSSYFLCRNNTLPGHIRSEETIEIRTMEETDLVQLSFNSSS